MNHRHAPLAASWVAALASLLLSACGESDPERIIDPCEGITCSGHGSCAVDGETAVCQCDPGYEPDALQCIDPNASVQTTDQVVQYGVAWTFDDLYPVGRYANGDYWVVGPLGVTSITPSFEGGHNGWEVNPSETSRQGFDERIGDYDASLVPALPYQASPGESLVKAVSTTAGSEGESFLQTAAVLTVVSEVPPDDGLTSFRPPYVGTDKAEYLTSELRTELLPTLEPTASAPALADELAAFQRVQLDHKEGWTGRAMHPIDNLPDYGSSIAARNAEGALALMLSSSLDDKQDLLVAYVQYGIDLFHMMRVGVRWTANGGHGEGRKLPACFAAALLGRADLQAEIAAAPAETFGESGGMAYSDAAGTVLWGQTPNSEDDYWTNVVFDTGSRTIIDPYHLIDGGHRPGDSYQFCCTSKAYKSTATALYLLPELVPIWNHQDFFDYVERWVSSGAWSQPDTCAPPDGVCVGGDQSGATCTSASEPEICTGTDAYCDLTVSWGERYGVTYGPDGAGGCIADTDSADGTGRFPLSHGAAADDGYYGSGFADELWASYVDAL